MQWQLLGSKTNTGTLCPTATFGSPTFDFAPLARRGLTRSANVELFFLSIHMHPPAVPIRAHTGRSALLFLECGTIHVVDRSKGRCPDDGNDAGVRLGVQP